MIEIKYITYPIDIKIYVIHSLYVYFRNTVHIKIVQFMHRSQFIVRE